MGGQLEFWATGEEVEWGGCTYPYSLGMDRVRDIVAG